jgi:hypothetical protein
MERQPVKRPTDEQFYIAKAWLEVNEGEGYEQEACVAVADWIAHKRQQRIIRQEARKLGVPMSRVRKQIAKSSAA